MSITRRQFILSLSGCVAGLSAGCSVMGVKDTHCNSVQRLSDLFLQDPAPVNHDSKNKLETPVFVSGEDGYDTYRIPSLIKTPSGVLVAFCEARKNNPSDNGDIDLVCRYSVDLGQTWSDTRKIYSCSENKYGNPCPIVSRSPDCLYLFSLYGREKIFFEKIPHDSPFGKDELANGFPTPPVTAHAPGPGKGIILKGSDYEGRLILPAYYKKEIDERSVSFSHVLYSDDMGRSWNMSDPVAPHTDECQVVELTDGSVMINMRNYTPGKRFNRAVSLSHDGGETWSPVRFDEDLIEPICQASLIRYSKISSSNNVLLFSNPASKSTRSSMTVRVSHDGGKSWPLSRVIKRGPAAYSSLAKLSESVVGCLFENGNKNPYEQISFSRFSMKWLKGN